MIAPRLGRGKVQATERSLAMKLKIILHREEDGRYSVAAPALPGCFSQGDTLEEAVANIREAAEGWLEAANERQPPFDGATREIEL
jgi:predicted RNase H-like HicB family nuclease